MLGFISEHRRTLWRLVLLAVLLVFVNTLYGCKKDTNHLDLARLLPVVGESHKIRNVPTLEQTDNFYAPAALVTLVEYHGGNLPFKEAVQMTYSTDEKTPPTEAFARALKRLGYIAIPVNTLDDIYKEVAADNPVVILRNNSFESFKLLPKWQFSLVVGYRIARGQILTNEGGTRDFWQPKDYIDATWNKAENWGYVAVPPHKLPASASEDKVLEAIEMFIKTGLFDRAAVAYKAVIKNYPQSPGGYIGLGNMEMARENYDAAEGHFRDALTVDASSEKANLGLAYSMYVNRKQKEACGLLEPFKEEHDSKLQNTYYQLCVYKR